MLRLELRPSRRLALVLSFAHAGAAAACLAAIAPSAWTVPLLALVGASWARALYGPAYLRSVYSIDAVEIRDDGDLFFRMRGGEWRSCRLLDSSFAAPYLTVLNLKEDGRRLARHAVVLPDSVSPEEFRRLQVWLRWRGAAPA